MNFYDWEDQYEAELYDAWCESDYDKIADFLDANWEAYQDSEDEFAIDNWENLK